MITMDILKVNAKAIVAFVVGILANAAVNLINGSAPWPQTGSEWLRYLGTSLVAGLAVYGTPNKLTPEQIVRSGVVVGQVVVPEIAATASAAAQETVKQAASQLPPVARTAITGISDQVGVAVDQVIRDFQNRPRA